MCVPFLTTLDQESTLLNSQKALALSFECGKCCLLDLTPSEFQRTVGQT